MKFKNKVLYLLFTMIMFFSPVTKLFAAVIDRTRYSDNSLEQKASGYQFLEQALTTDLHMKHQSHSSHGSHSSHSSHASHTSGGHYSHSSGSGGSGGGFEPSISSFSSTSVKKYLRYTSQQYDSFNLATFDDFYISESQRGFRNKTNNLNYLLSVSPFNSYTALPYVYEDKEEKIKFFAFIPFIMSYSLGNIEDEFDRNKGIGDLIIGTLVGPNQEIKNNNIGISLSLPTGSFAKAIKRESSPLGSGNLGIQFSLDVKQEWEFSKWVQYCYLMFRSSSTVTSENITYDIFVPTSFRYDNFFERKIDKYNTISLFVKSTFIPYGDVSEGGADPAELFFCDLIVTLSLEYTLHLKDYQIKVGVKLPSLNSAEYESSSKADMNIQFKLNDPVNFISSIYKKIRD